MGDKKFWVALAIILVIAGLITLAVLYHKPANDAPTVSPDKHQLGIEADELDGITIIIPGAEKGSYWDLKLAKCTYNNNNIGHLESINGVLFNTKRIILYRVTAQTGKIYWKTRKLQLLGNVKFSLEDNTRRELNADEVIWDPGEKKRAGVIIARGQVTLQTSDSIVSATQLSTDPAFKKMIFSGATKASFHKPEFGK